MIDNLSKQQRLGLLLASLVLAGFTALSVHVGLLAAGVPFPLPRPPIWARWLSESFIVGGLLAFLKFAQPSIGDRSVMVRAIIVGGILIAVQETLRAAIMNGVVTGGWVHSSVTLIKPLINAFIVAFLCVVVVRWVRSASSLLFAALVVPAISTAARQFVGYALEPVIQHFASTARPDLYEFPYPFHVTLAAYLTFAEAVAGVLVMTMLIWDHLPKSKPFRLLILALLAALVKGTVGYTLVYSFFTGDYVQIGALSWSQFLLEFLTLGCLVGLCWDAFGRRRMPASGNVIGAFIPLAKGKR